MRKIIYPEQYLEIISMAEKRGLTKKKAKELGIGGQMHHIIPRCVAPELEKEKSNIVFLTHEEHYIAHKLLALANPDDNISIAWNRMTKGKNTKQFCTQEDYSKAMELSGRLSSERMSGDNNPSKRQDVKIKQRELHKGIKFTQEHCDNISKALTGKTKSENHCRNMSASLKGRKKPDKSGSQKEPVVHIETGTIIESQSAVEQWANDNNIVGVHRENIRKCIEGTASYCGKNYNGEKQHWRKLTEEELCIWRSSNDTQ